MSLEPLFRAAITLAPLQELGEDHRGRHRTIAITGGTFRGARLAGRVLGGGADWQVIRPDGVAQLDARYMLQTDDGAVIYVHNQGYRHGMEADPSGYYMRTTPRFETFDPRYAWLNRIVCIATGLRHPESVELEVYEVT